MHQMKKHKQNHNQQNVKDAANKTMFRWIRVKIDSCFFNLMQFIIVFPISKYRIFYLYLLWWDVKEDQLDFSKRQIRPAKFFVRPTGGNLKLRIDAEGWKAAGPGREVNTQR